MKYVIIYISTFILFSPLHALNQLDGETQTSSFPPKIQYRPIKDIKWGVLNAHIQEGYELGAQQLWIQFNNFLSYQVSGDLTLFKENFERCFAGTLRRTIEKHREVKELLGQFHKYLSYAYKANDAFIRRDTVDKDSHGIGDRTKVSKNKQLRDISFAELQAVTNLLFKGLAELKLYTFDDSRGIIPATDTGMIAYSMDESGYIPIPVLNASYTQVVNINWGQFEPEYQGNYVLKNGTLIRESGFVLEVMAGNRLKVRGYNGDKGENPFTAHKTTASTWLKSDNKILDIFQGILPFEVIIGARKLSENEGIFVAIPSGHEDWKMLELLFMEGFQTQEGVNPQPINANIISDFEDATKKIDELRNELISDYEAQIRAEQQARSKLVKDGKTQGRSKQVKKKTNRSKGKGKAKGKAKGKGKGKGKGKPSSSATNSAEPKNPQYLARALYEKHKAECRIKYRDLLKILNNIISEFPEQVKARISTKGSHINVHGEETGFTIVRPHGGKDDLPPYLANRIINQLLSFIQNQ